MIIPWNIIMHYLFTNRTWWGDCMDLTITQMGNNFLHEIRRILNGPYPRIASTKATIAELVNRIHGILNHNHIEPNIFGCHSRWSKDSCQSVLKPSEWISSTQTHLISSTVAFWMARSQQNIKVHGFPTIRWGSWGVSWSCSLSLGI